MTIDITGRAMLVTLNLRTWGGSRSDRALAAETAQRHSAEESAVTTLLHIIPREYLRPIKAIDTAIRRLHYSLTLPWGDDGTRILPSAVYHDHAARIGDMLAERDRLVGDFIAALPRIEQDAKARLNGLFRPEDFPTPDDARAAFRSRLVHLPFPDAQDFRVSLAKDDLAFVEASLRDELNETLASATAALRDRLLDGVQDFFDRVSRYRVIPDPDARTGVRVEGGFHETAVSNLRALAETAPKLNVTQDPAIDALAARILARLCRADATALKETDVLREAVLKDAKGILIANGRKA